MTGTSPSRCCTCGRWRPPARQGPRWTSPGAERSLFDERFLLERPVLRALRTSPSVLLVDEVDRADDEFEAFLLEVLSTWSVRSPSWAPSRRPTPPVVVLTSNRTREVHDALKRRCLYHWVEHPSLAREIEIVRTRLPDLPRALAEQVAAATQRLRDLRAAQAARRRPAPSTGPAALGRARSPGPRHRVGGDHARSRAEVPPRGCHARAARPRSAAGRLTWPDRDRAREHANGAPRPGRGDPAAARRAHPRRSARPVSPVTPDRTCVLPHRRGRGGGDRPRRPLLGRPRHLVQRPRPPASVRPGVRRVVRGPAGPDGRGEPLPASPAPRRSPSWPMAAAVAPSGSRRTRRRTCAPRPASRGARHRDVAELDEGASRPGCACCSPPGLRVPLRRTTRHRRRAPRRGVRLGAPARQSLRRCGLACSASASAVVAVLARCAGPRRLIDERGRWSRNAYALLRLAHCF